MFRYLLLKSLFDGLILLMRPFEHLLMCADCPYRYTYMLNLFDIVSNKYLIRVCTLCSICFELAAQLDRLLTLSQVCRCFTRKTSHRLISLVVVLVISSFYSYELFTFYISPKAASARELPSSLGLHRSIVYANSTEFDDYEDDAETSYQQAFASMSN